MVNAPENEKAKRYIQQLDEARCAGRWADVPELCRKVEKHAPHRKCLTVTARSETQIAAYSTQRPSTASSTSSAGLSQIVPSLLAAIDEDSSHDQDVFQATVCIAWTHYVLDELAQAVSRLPKDFGVVATELSSEAGGSLHGWSRVCLVKGSYIRGSALEKTGAVGEALTAYSSIMPWLSSAITPSTESAQFHMWGEHSIVRLCQLSDQSTSTGENVTAFDALRTYRYWAKFWDASSKNNTTDIADSAQHRRLAWKAYYDSLSIILHRNLPYEPDSTPVIAEKPSSNPRSDIRLRQRAELKRVETIYENLLIKETKFPKASETNHEVESWVDSVMDNWRLLCGPTWSDEDLGEGGKEGVARGVLDILYRAATKTYHSTQILRNMFVVHASLAEPDIEHWLEQAEHRRAAKGDASVASAEPVVEPMALAAAYCAIGVSQAHWARLTYDVETRSSIQTKAVQYLRKALSPQLGDENNVEALYALALVLAEVRDIPGAIKIAKRALSSVAKGTAISTDGVLSDGITSEFGRERKLMPVWHLLALLLTSRSDFAAAERACEAAFEQFGDPTVMFGRGDSGAYRSEHLNDAVGQDSPDSGVVDRMERFEKSNILQIKMTQLALLEITDGATAAVDGCDELLALYGRLFGNPTVDVIKPPTPPAALAPPKTAIGTGRGSIFRGRGSVRAQQDNAARNASAVSSKTATTQPDQAPAIQVTNNESAADPNSHHRHHLFHHKHEDGQVGVTRTASKLQKRRSRSASLGKASIPETDLAQGVPPLPETVVDGSALPNVSRKSNENGERPLRSIPHNLDHSAPPLAHDHPPRQDMRLPSALPRADYVPSDPYFSKIQERRQKVSLLVSIWIFISRLYARAHMFQDAREAVTEALKLVETFEAEVSVESATAKALADKGWGGGKSVEELWADVFATRGELLVAQSMPHEARADFERALQHFPDHPEGIVGLSNILLDIYNESIPLEPVDAAVALSPSRPTTAASIQTSQSMTKSQYLTSHTPSAENQLSPPALTRLAARDRAFGLLSTLTKLGAGWDYSEAWYALARAYEESGQIEKTKEVLWWCVELEDTHPMRSWKSVNTGGFVL
ncbi:hypothetical protein GGP41_007346 [Bipolaris sorokiniana]|uniref:Filamentation protein n=1 Tax=Cochliobolus sativus TaxID=45130 RepID=A0A8H5ZUF3_COCSA|nr:hypothetical protein GGP41_007346 [Bipolaris sorokiniana]